MVLYEGAHVKVLLEEVVDEPARDLHTHTHMYIQRERERL